MLARLVSWKSLADSSVLRGCLRTYTCFLYWRWRLWNGCWET